MYSIVDRKSFENLDNWLNIVKENNGDDGYVIGVAANKNDLYKNATVTDKEGEKYAKKHNAIFKKTSVKDKVGIKELVEELVKEYLDLYKNPNETYSIDPKTLKKGSIIKPQKKGCCPSSKGNNNPHQNNNDGLEQNSIEM